MLGKLLQVISLCTIVAITGCTSYGQQEQAGMVIGGALGGYLGSQVDDRHHGSTAAIIAGTLMGAAIGGGIGLALAWFFKRYHLRDTHKVILFMIIAVVFYDLAEEPAVKALVPIAALLGIMAIGFVILEKNNELANRLASTFGKIWVLSEILLFVYIGTEVRMEVLDANLVGIGLLILAIGLMTRSLGVWVALMGSDLSAGERLFCIIAYLPKATVQAAMGAVPLAMVMEGRMTSMTVESGQVILAMAVLSIVVTAPLGAIGIKVAGPRLLAQD